MITLFCILISSCIIQAAEEPLQVSPTLFIPHNAVNGDELVDSLQFRAFAENDEDFALSLTPASDLISVSPSIVQPNSPIQIVVNDVDRLRKNNNSYVIGALGLITGESHEYPISFSFGEDEFEPSQAPSDADVTDMKNIFPQDSYDLKLESALTEREMAIVKLADNVPLSVHFSLVGPYSDHFEVRRGEAASVVVGSVPCAQCRIPHQFTIVLENSLNNDVVTLNFETEEREELQFVKSVYETEIEEESSTFKKLIKLRTKGSSNVVYSLEDISGLFAVHPKNGLLIIQHPEFLFVDTVGEVVNVTAVASAGTQRTSTTILIHVIPKQKENGFMFKKAKYTFNVDKALRKIGNVSVDAMNQNVMYSISEGDLSQFTVNDGQIEYIAPFEKDMQKYRLLVTAQSMSSPFSAAVTEVKIVLAGIGSSPISFVANEHKNTRLMAEAAPGTTILTSQVEDGDEDVVVEFSLTNQRATDLNGRPAHFPRHTVAVESEGKTAIVVLKESIENLQLSSIGFTLTARDVTHPEEPTVEEEVEVFVLRTHEVEKEPLALKFIEVPPTVVVPSSIPLGSSIYQIRTNRNNGVKFELEKPTTMLAIDEKTGLLITTSMLKSGARIELPIVASIDSDTTRTNITVEVSAASPLPPRFKSAGYEAELPGNVPPGTPVANVPVDVPMNVAFSLSGSPDFTIDDQGMIRTVSQLSPEINQYLLLAEATTEYGTGTAEVAVSVLPTSEKELTFDRLNYDVTIMENIPINSFVLDTKIKTTSVPLNYSLSSDGDISDILNIDQDGKITTSDEFRSPGNYSFNVLASDGTGTATATVNLRVLQSFDCVPQFKSNENNMFIVEENLSPDAEIGTVTTYPLDDKCELRFYFWDSSAHKTVTRTEFASIDEQTGVIRAEKSFDYEKVRQYPMVLCLVAGEREQVLHSSQLVVRDVGDNPILFDKSEMTVEILESSEVGAVVATVEARDRDASQPIFYQLKEENDHFVVDSETGSILLNQPLDREVEDSYELEVRAANIPDVNSANFTVRCKLNIMVRDVNDNGPIFEKSRYEVLLSKHELPGKVIARVQAQDPDLSEQGLSPVFYSFADTVFEYKGMSRPIKGLFTIERTTGNVRLAQSVSDFVGGVFHLLLESADSAEDSARKGKAVMRVYVHDHSDIIEAEIEKSPLEVQPEDIRTLTQTITNSTGLKAMVKDVRYQHIGEHLVHDATLVQLVLLNKTTSETIAAERALALVELARQQSSDSQMPSLAKAQTSVRVAESTLSPVILILAVFALLLLIICVIFALLICHYRKRYEREAKLHVDDVIISTTLNRPKSRPFVPTPPLSTPSDPYPTRDDYSTQERQLSVGPEEVRKSR